jgi:predicted methyltransferase MtxX (methanogen marker protein 4)
MKSPSRNFSVHALTRRVAPLVRGKSAEKSAFPRVREASRVVKRTAVLDNNTNISFRLKAGGRDPRRHVGNRIRLRRNEKERIYRNKLPLGPRD